MNQNKIGLGKGLSAILGEIDEETKQVNIGTGTNTTFYKSIGMTEMEVEQAYNGQW